ncbi:MAG TPA: helix-turn-helix domain-containing protein [Acidimicrobiales bacterium]|nr:helix-turn-helix domain-containing protein [Acidimicrobiales bacterium]
MPRASPPKRLVDVAKAATGVFGRLGYRRAHMAEVATQAGLSAGAVYTYVESKEALFHLVFAHAFGQFAEGMPSLPLATPAFAETLELIGQGLRKTTATPLLKAALDQSDPGDIETELTTIIEERYAMTERVWPVLAVIERCAVDLPELEALYFQRGRPRHLAQLTRYLELRAASGHLRTMTDATVAARIVTESITWFAWHRREDRDARFYDDEAARRTVIEFVCHALIEPRW